MGGLGRLQRQRGWDVPQTEFGLRVAPAAVALPTCTSGGGEACRSVKQNLPLSGVFVRQCMCKVIHEVNGRRGTYLQCPICRADGVRQSDPHLQDKVRSLLGGSIAVRSCKNNVRGGLPVQIPMAREGYTFRSAQTLEPCTRIGINQRVDVNHHGY